MSQVVLRCYDFPFTHPQSLICFAPGGPRYPPRFARADHFKMPLPSIHSVVLNRSTQYSKKASKAFGAMFDEIKKRVITLKAAGASHFAPAGPHFEDVPDSHSVAIVCSHLGIPLFALTPGRYEVHDTEPQVNSEPLERYKTACHLSSSRRSSMAARLRISRSPASPRRCRIRGPSRSGASGSCNNSLLRLRT
jgi:hypothetical protein